MMDSKTFCLATLKRCITFFILTLCVMTMTISAVAKEAADKSSVMLGKAYVQTEGSVKVVAIDSMSATVGDILDSLEIKVEDIDEVTPSVEKRVKDGDKIVFVNREYRKVTNKGAIPFETVSTYSKDAEPGTTTVTKEGIDGKGTQILKQLVEDGVVIKQEIISEDIEVAPVNKEMVIGFEKAPISSFDFGWSFDENGDPINTVNVLREHKATAYTAPTGALTSTGVQAAVGYVAVNPNVIPYGSKLFIKSNDGYMIYGYAIAADTGGALMRGTADVDLFLTTKDSCTQHGVRKVDIFVLETPVK